MRYYLTMAYSIFDQENYIINIDSVIENGIDFEKWENTSGGFEFQLPVKRIGSDNIATYVAGNPLSEDDIEFEIAEDLNMQDLIMWLDAENRSILQPYFDASVLCRIYIKSEMFFVASITYNSSKDLYECQLEWGQNDEMPIRWTNYPKTSSSSYVATSYPSTYIGRRVILRNTGDRKVAFVGRIAEEPTLKGNMMAFKVKSELDALDIPIQTETDERLEQQEATFRQILFPSTVLNDAKELRTEFGVLRGLELQQNLDYVDSTFRMGDFKTFREVLQLFCQLNQVFLQLDSFFGSTGTGDRYLPRWTFKKFAFSNKQLQDSIETRTIAKIKNVNEKISCEFYNGVGSVTIKAGKGEVTANNTRGNNIRKNSTLTITIPEGVVLKDGGTERSLSAKTWFASFFQTFGRVYQKITIPSLGTLAGKFWEAGKLYYVSDLHQYRTLVSSSVSESESNLCYCTGVYRDRLELLHLRDFLQYPIPPCFVAEVGLSVINYDSGFEGYAFDIISTLKYPSNFSDLDELQMPDSDYYYYKTGDKITLRAVTNPTTKLDATIVSVGSSWLEITPLATTVFTADDLVTVEYGNKDDVTGEQLQWLFIEE